MYRVSGGNAKEVGSYMSMTPQGGGLQSQLDLALNPVWGNTTENVTKVVVPKGTTQTVDKVHGRCRGLYLQSVRSLKIQTPFSASSFTSSILSWQYSAILSIARVPSVSRRPATIFKPFSIPRFSILSNSISLMLVCAPFREV